MNDAPGGGLGSGGFDERAGDKPLTVSSVLKEFQGLKDKFKNEDEEECEWNGPHCWHGGVVGGGFVFWSRVALLAPLSVVAIIDTAVELSITAIKVGHHVGDPRQSRSANELYQ